MAQDVVIVHNLSQADALAEEVFVDMRQRVDAVERSRWNSNFSHTFGQFDTVGELLFFQRFCETIDLPERVRPLRIGRNEMYLHFRILENRILSMVEFHLQRLADLFFQIAVHLFPSAFHPDVDVARLTAVGIGIETGHALSLQDAGAKTILPKLLGQFRSAQVEKSVFLLYFLCQHKPFHHQFRRWLQLFGQSLNAHIEQSRYSMESGRVVDSFPLVRTDLIFETDLVSQRHS